MIIFTGIQATGKSTFYKENFFRTHVRINLDMLKTRHREKLLFEACLRMKQPFVVDNTNPARADRTRYILPAKEAGFCVKGYYFRSDIASALLRNSLRTGREQIPEKGVRATAARLERPSLSEGFDALSYVAIDEKNGFRVTEWTGE